MAKIVELIRLGGICDLVMFRCDYKTEKVCARLQIFSKARAALPYRTGHHLLNSNNADPALWVQLYRASSGRFSKITKNGPGTAMVLARPGINQVSVC